MEPKEYEGMCKQWSQTLNNKCHTIISFDRSMALNMDNTHFSISVLYVSQTRRERPEIFLASCDVREHAVLKTLCECSLWL